MRDRKNIGKLSVNTVNSKPEKDKAEINTYTMTLRSMTKGSVERYRSLKKKKMIPNGFFNDWVDDLIQNKLDTLEKKYQAKDIKIRDNPNKKD